MIEQKMIKISEVDIPIIIDDGVEYYPISYLSEKVLLRKGSIVASSSNKKVYASYIKKFQIDYSTLGGGIQETNCINKNGLINVLSKSKIGRLDTKQRKMNNEINKYLGVDIRVSEEERFIHNIEELYVDKDDYVRDVYIKISNDYKGIPWQKCTKCNEYYPFHIDFFRENRRSPHGLDTYCYNCKYKNTGMGKTKMQLNDWNLNRAYHEQGEEFYNLCKSNDIIGIYEYYFKNNIGNVPDKIYNERSYVKIIKNIIDNNSIKDKNVKVINMLENKYKLINASSIVSAHKIFIMFYGENYYLRPWKIKEFQNVKKYFSYSILKGMVNLYIKENNITIEEIYNYNYVELFKKVNIYHLIEKELVKFLLYFYAYEISCYMFKSINYHKPMFYEKVENRNMDFKFLVEKDFKVPLEKIPLYVTLGSVQRRDTSLYNMIKKYYKNLFEITNECYPDLFIENDFTNNKYRDEFDSIEESQVNEVLRENFPNVIYNNRKNINAIKIKGMIPDWIIITEEGCWFVEYFGMYSDKTYNTRVYEYVEKTKRKINTYDDLINFKKLYIYPNDLGNVFEGLKNKIREII